MAVETISCSISTKVWGGDQTLAPGTAVRHVSAVRHVTDCATINCVLLLQLRFLVLQSSH